MVLGGEDGLHSTYLAIKPSYLQRGSVQVSSAADVSGNIHNFEEKILNIIC